METFGDKNYVHEVVQWGTYERPSQPCVAKYDTTWTFILVFLLYIMVCGEGFQWVVMAYFDIV